MASFSASNNSDVSTANLIRALILRLDSLKSQYQQELTPLAQQHEALTREIAELKAVRDVFLEETTVLNARNEELAQLTAQYARRMETSKQEMVLNKKSGSFDKPLPSQQSLTMSHPLAQSASRSSSYSDDTADPSKSTKVQKHDMPEFSTPSTKRGFMKWGASKTKEAAHPPVVENNGRGKASVEHTFQQVSLLRFTRCDHCQEKMWGSQVRCTRKSITFWPGRELIPCLWY